MKKIIVGVLCFIGVFLFSSCYESIYKNDLEEYAENGYYESTVGLTSFPYFVPTNTFLRDYPYLDGGYHYHDIQSDEEIAILYVTYSEDTYLLAKEFAISVFNLSKTNIYFYNGYEFAENLLYADYNGKLKDGINTDFPKIFTMFAFNDKNYTLIFMSFYARYKHKKNVDASNWQLFLETYYTEYYDFDE